MTDILGRTIADSIGQHSPRLWTVETRAPCMIHQEVLRHRRLITEEGLSVLGLGWEPDFSFSVSSTRAVPFAKMLEECRDPRLAAAPIHWGRAQRGMVPGDEIDDVEKCVNWSDVIFDADRSQIGIPDEFITRRECARRLWDLHGALSADIAEAMVKFCDPHKSIPNRMMQPHLHYNVLMTGTEPGWLNFFGLRLDAAADPIVRALAEVLWREWNESQPRKLKPGEWHLPYADDEQSYEEASEFCEGELIAHEYEHYSPVPAGLGDVDARLKQMSVARCAHLSYTSFETGERMTVDQCLKLYDRLVGSVPIHASPAEHQAIPDILCACHFVHEDKSEVWVSKWMEPEKSGNLGPGWVQLRKLLPDEAVAPLPEAYR